MIKKLPYIKKRFVGKRYCVKMNVPFPPSLLIKNCSVINEHLHFEIFVDGFYVEYLGIIRKIKRELFLYFSIEDKQIYFFDVQCAFRENPLSKIQRYC